MAASEKTSSPASVSAKVILAAGLGLVCGYVASRIFQSKSVSEQNTENTLQCGKYRRIITGHDEKGTSVVLRTDSIINMNAPKGRNITVFNVWRCLDYKTANDEDDINVADLCAPNALIPLQPSSKGSNFRIIEFRPESTVSGFYKTDQDKVAAAWSDFGVQDNKVFGKKEKPHPFFHTTASIDYAICLYGKIWMVMDDEEVIVKAGGLLFVLCCFGAFLDKSNVIMYVV